MKLSIEENNEQIPKFYLMYNIQTMVGLLQTILYFNLLLANLEYLTKETWVTCTTYYDIRNQQNNN